MRGQATEWSDGGRICRWSPALGTHFTDISGERDGVESGLQPSRLDSGIRDGGVSSSCGKARCLVREEMSLPASGLMKDMC